MIDWCFIWNHLIYSSQIDPLISVNPFLIPGEDWKKTRNQLSPLFLPRRILTAIPLINNVCKTMIEYIECGPESSNSEFDVKDVRKVLNITRYVDISRHKLIFDLTLFRSLQQNSRLTSLRPLHSVSMDNRLQIQMLTCVELETKFSSQHLSSAWNSRFLFSCRSWRRSWKLGEGLKIEPNRICFHCN